MKDNQMEAPSLSEPVFLKLNTFTLGWKVHISNRVIHLSLINEQLIFISILRSV